MKHYFNPALEKWSKRVLIPLAYGSLVIGCSSTKTKQEQYFSKIPNDKNITKITTSKRRFAAKISKAEKKLHKQILNVRGQTDLHKLLELEKLFKIKIPPEIYPIFKEIVEETKKELINLGLYYKNITSLNEAKQILEVYGKAIDKRLPYEPTALISHIYPKNKADCDIKTYLTLAVNQKHPSPLPLYYVPLHGHAIVRCQFGDPNAPRIFSGSAQNCFNWECTSSSIDKSTNDDYYLKTSISTTQKQADSKLYLHNATEDEITSKYIRVISTQLEKRNDSIRACKQALKINPKNLAALTDLASCYVKNEQYDQAEKYFAQAERINPNYAWTYQHKASMFKGKGEYQKALEESNKAINTFPHQSAFFEMRGHIHYELEQYNMALRDLDQALKLDPKEPHPLVYKAYIYEDKEDFAKAETTFKEAIKISPDEAYYRNELAYFYCRQEKSAEAKVSLDKALELEPKNGFTHRLLGKVYLKEEQYSLAKQYLEKAIDLGEANSNIFSDLAYANYYLGNEEEASKNFKKAYELDPSDRSSYINHVLTDNPEITWPFIRAYYFIGGLFGD